MQYEGGFADFTCDAPIKGECVVTRWSGRHSDKPRPRFVGSYRKALAKFNKIADEMRQGEVRLIGPRGDVLKRRWAPCLRTRW